MSDETERAMLVELKKISHFLELLYNLFSKYDSQALLELEELRAAEEKPRK